MTFGSSPSRVVFTAVVNHSVALSPLNVTASGVSAPAVAVAAGAPYTPVGTVVFRRDTITVTAAAGGTITSVRIAAPGFIALIDDMQISP